MTDYFIELNTIITDCSRSSLSERTQKALNKLNSEYIKDAVQQCIQVVTDSADKGNWTCCTTLEHPIKNIVCLRNHLQVTFIGCNIKLPFIQHGKIEVIITWS